MLPVLLDLKFVKIYTFGVFLVLAFFWGSFLLWKLIRLTVYKEEDVFDGLFLSLAGAFFFARVFYVALNFDKFGFNLLKFILINGYPGLALYGGLMGGLVVFYLFCFFKKIKFEDLIDYFIPPLFLSLAFGKLGSFFSGSEAVIKLKLSLLAPFFESLFFFLATFFSYKLLFEIRREKYPQKFNFYFFGWYFALTYFLFDKVKAFHLYFLGYSFNRLLSLILLLTTSFYFLYYFRSLIFSRVSMISNLVFTYGKKTYQKIYHSAKNKIRR